MLPKLFGILLVFLAVQAISNAKSDNEGTEIDLSQYPVSVRDPDTGIEYNGTFVHKKQHGSSGALVYNDLPCRCENTRCSCCSNIRILHLNWNVCLNAALRSEDPPLTFSLTVNDRVVMEHNTPLDIQFTCIRIFDWDFLQICVGIKDIRFDGKNLHFCPEVRLKIYVLPEISVFHKCVNINADGISVEKFLLEYNRTISRIEYETNELKMYEEMDIEQQDFEVRANRTSAHSPDEEVQIGELKP